MIFFCFFDASSSTVSLSGFKFIIKRKLLNQSFAQIIIVIYKQNFTCSHILTQSPIFGASPKTYLT